MNFRVGRLIGLFIGAIGIWVTRGTSAAEAPVSRDEKSAVARTIEVARQSLREAETRRELLARMERVMGKFPGEERRCDLAVKVLEEVDCGGYLRRFLTYQSEPGGSVPAYLLTPKGELMRKGPNGKPIGILTLHQTHALGQKVVVGLGGSTNDEYAVELVKRGFVCLAPAYPHLANYAPSLTNWESGTMKAIWDNVRGLDLLAEFAGCDGTRFGAIGHSLGGHNSLYTAAFDERIKVAVTSCGFDSFVDYMDSRIKGWTQDRYMPKLAEHAPDWFAFDFDTVLRAIAPRRVFVSAPKHDSNFKWDSVDRVVAKARQQSNVVVDVEHPDCEHKFPREMREKAYGVIEEVLLSR
jgi:dienelactone hydrolase